MGHKALIIMKCVSKKSCGCGYHFRSTWFIHKSYWHWLPHGTEQVEGGININSFIHSVGWSIIHARESLAAHSYNTIVIPAGLIYYLSYYSPCDTNPWNEQPPQFTENPHCGYRGIISLTANSWCLQIVHQLECKLDADWLMTASGAMKR